MMTHYKFIIQAVGPRHSFPLALSVNTLWIFHSEFLNILLPNMCTYLFVTHFFSVVLTVGIISFRVSL